MPRQNWGAIICSHEAVDLSKGDLATYSAFRDKVLKAGRFSVFEATETKAKAQLFDQLCRDSEIVTDHSCGFPWTTVRARAQKETQHAG